MHGYDYSPFVMLNIKSAPLKKKRLFSFHRRLLCPGPLHVAQHLLAIWGTEHIEVCRTRM